MSNLFTERVLNMTAVTPQPEDYMGVTATRQNVTARKPSVWSVKPPNSAESTLTPWRT